MLLWQHYIYKQAKEEAVCLRSLYYLDVARALQLASYLSGRAVLGYFCFIGRVDAVGRSVPNVQRHFHSSSQSQSLQSLQTLQITSADPANPANLESARKLRNSGDWETPETQETNLIRK